MNDRTTSRLGRCPFGGAAAPSAVSRPRRTSAEAPACPGRRSLLIGLGLAGGAFGLSPVAAASLDETQARRRGRRHAGPA